MTRETGGASMACPGNGWGRAATVRIKTRFNSREDSEEVEP